MKKHIITLTLTLFTISGALAQANFSGTWKIKERTPLSGTDYANSIAKLIVVGQAADSLKLVRTSIGAQNQDVTFAETIGTGAGPTMIHSSGRKETVLLKWGTSHNSFIETATFSKTDNENDPDYQRTENWELSADGITLTITKNFQSLVNADDKWSVKGVFEKQDQ